jgi:hypothetical protein
MEKLFISLNERIPEPDQIDAGKTSKHGYIIIIFVVTLMIVGIIFIVYKFIFGKESDDDNKSKHRRKEKEQSDDYSMYSTQEDDEPEIIQPTLSTNEENMLNNFELSFSVPQNNNDNQDFNSDSSDTSDYEPDSFVDDDESDSAITLDTSSNKKVTFGTDVKNKTGTKQVNNNNPTKNTKLYIEEVTDDIDTSIFGEGPTLSDVKNINNNNNVEEPQTDIDSLIQSVLGNNINYENDNVD